MPNTLGTSPVRANLESQELPASGARRRKRLRRIIGVWAMGVFAVLAAAAAVIALLFPHTAERV